MLAVVNARDIIPNRLIPRPRHRELPTHQRPKLRKWNSDRDLGVRVCLQVCGIRQGLDRWLVRVNVQVEDDVFTIRIGRNGRYGQDKYLIPVEALECKRTFEKFFEVRFYANRLTMMRIIAR